MKRLTKKQRYEFFESIGVQAPAVRSITDIMNDIDSLSRESFMAIDKPHELETLSQAAAKMPAYMKGLGYYLADAENETNLAKDALEYTTLKKEKSVMDEGKTAALATRTVATDDEVIGKQEAYRHAQHNYKILKLQYDASDRQFEGWRSRLSVIKNDLGRT